MAVVARARQPRTDRRMAILNHLDKMIVDGGGLCPWGQWRRSTLIQLSRNALGNLFHKRRHLSKSWRTSEILGEMASFIIDQTRTQACAPSSSPPDESTGQKHASTLRMVRGRSFARVRRRTATCRIRVIRSQHQPLSILYAHGL